MSENNNNPLTKLILKYENKLINPDTKKKQQQLIYQLVIQLVTI